MSSVCVQRGGGSTRVGTRKTHTLGWITREGADSLVAAGFLAFDNGLLVKPATPTPIHGQSTWTIGDES